ncbi:MAG TPA: sigma 54-interacting transcriptional regulator [Gemmataceae bacterium]|nr:sigma 54-interacting transcriptional regulator [Gemmataceae bacterium]
MQARLVVEAGDGAPGEVDLSPDDPVSMGRSRDNTIVLRDEHASRLHARIHFADGHWQIQDFGLNGTFVNGERIHKHAQLEHGQEIRIGKVRMRFQLPDPPSSSQFRLGMTNGARERPTMGSPSTARLHIDETAILCHFMAGATAIADPARLLRNALQLTLTQSNSYVAGYLSPDAAEPHPKVVVPDTAGIDLSLSRQLTRRVQRDGKTVWLGTNISESRPADSMREVTDAVCVPVRSGGKTLGMVHVYKKGQFFAERDVRFVEAMAEFLGGCLQQLHVQRRLQLQTAFLRSHPLILDELIGDSAPMVKLRQQIAEVAPQPLPVLIHGEPGVGVEVVAWNLHHQSARVEGPLVAVACQEVAPAMLEGDLFGKRTSAAGESVSCHSACADEGSLFLDEVAILSLECQHRLHRMLEEKRFRPLGSPTEMPCDTRLIAATQYELSDAVANGQFRKDLYECLNVLTVELPPLRTHLEDIPYLVQYFLDKLAVRSRRLITLTDAAMRKLCSYSWPGNTRQLRAELEGAVLRTTREVIEEGELLQGCERLLVARPGG